MAIAIVRQHHPPTIKECIDPKWWIYELSYYENIIEHRGACHQMHVARMLDTISAQVLPIPVCDKRNMIGLLRYVLQTDFSGVDIYSFENKSSLSKNIINLALENNTPKALLYRGPLFSLLFHLPLKE